MKKIIPAAPAITPTTNIHAPADARALAALTVATLREKQGRDIMVYDARNSHAGTDFYILVSALSSPHIKALHNTVRLALKNAGAVCYRKSGTPESGWIVADYLDLVAHFFSAETRAYYNLEELWAGLPRLDDL